jgi:hypothetical protein
MRSTSRYCGCGLLVLAVTGTLAPFAAAQNVRYKLQDLDVSTIRKQLAAFTQADRNRPLVNAAKAVADVMNTNTVDLQFNRVVPRLGLSFLATTDPPRPVKPVKDMVREFLNQLLLERAEYLKLEPNVDVSLRRRPGAAVTGYDVFQAPEGLTVPVDCLLAMRGCACPSPNCFAFTPSNCFELAKDCYRRCMFKDALALLKHAVKHDRQASYYYLKAMTELQLGSCQDALASVREMLGAQAEGLTDGLAATMEGYNGPYRAQVDELAKVADASK